MNFGLLILDYKETFKNVTDLYNKCVYLPLKQSCGCPNRMLWYLKFIARPLDLTNRNCFN